LAKSKNNFSEEPVRRSRPALTPEARENQLIALAVDLVEQRLRDGTASSQEVVQVLKLGTTRERLEKELLVKQKELMDAKAKALQSSDEIKQLYKDALQAMRIYAGQGDIPQDADY
jgi:hypothetical protein